MKKDQLEIKLQELRDLANKDDNAIEWTTKLKEENPIVISAIIAWLGSTGIIGAKFEALRDSAYSILETRLTNQLIFTMEKLDKSSSRLSVVGIALMVIIGVLSVIVAL